MCIFLTMKGFSMTLQVSGDPNKIINVDYDKSDRVRDVNRAAQIEAVRRYGEEFEGMSEQQIMDEVGINVRGVFIDETKNAFEEISNYSYLSFSRR